MPGRSLRADLAEDRKVELRRVQLDLGPKAYDRLTKLKIDTEATTYAEVIRNALKLYAFAVAQHEAGREFMLREPDGKIIPAPIFQPD